MINLEFRSADDSGPLPALVGTSLDGAAVTQLGLVKNTGDEAVTVLRMWLTNDLSRPLTCTASVNGVALPDVQNVQAGSVPQESVSVLQAPLAPGATLALSITFNGPSGTLFEDVDSCAINWGAQ